MNSVQALAAWFALLPMAIGLSVLGLFVVTDNHVLPVLGVMVLWFGVAMSVAAGVLALVGDARARRDRVPRVHRWCVLSGIAALVVANYPLAAVCARAGIAWATRYTLELDNRAETPWLIGLRGPGIDEAVTVAAGERTNRRLWFCGDGELTLQAGDHAEPLVVESYVTNGLGGAAGVTRRANGELVVFNPP